MIVRKIAAIMIGVYSAALINAVLLTVSSGWNPSAGFFTGLLFVATAGAIVTAPAWVVFCIILLPAVTHRANKGLSLPRSLFLLVAFGLGALLIIPVFAVLGILEPPAVYLAPVLGGIGGVAIAAMWSILVLDTILPNQEAGAPRA